MDAEKKEKIFSHAEIMEALRRNKTRNITISEKIKSKRFRSPWESGFVGSLGLLEICAHKGTGGVSDWRSAIVKSASVKLAPAKLAIVKLAIAKLASNKSALSK